MTEACDLSARDARRMMGNGALSPVELFDSCRQRIERVNPAVNAIVAERFDDARKEAEAAETAIQRGDSLPLLHGLPIGVKDANEVGGLRSTYGSLIYKDNIPKQDEGLVKAVRGNGAIVMGKTNTPEFTAGANTVNLVYGVTRNPFDTDLTCGGSSGGTAVANYDSVSTPEGGEAIVVRPGKEYEELSRNELEARTFASYAVYGSSLLIRSEKHLYRISN